MHLRQPVIELAVRALFAAATFSVPAQAAAGVPPQSGRPSAAGVQALLDDGRYARAEERARELVSPASLEGCEKSLEVAEHLRLLARAMWLNGKQADPERRRVAELALATAIEVAGELSLAVAENRFDLAILDFMLGDYATARRVSRRRSSRRRNSSVWIIWSRQGFVLPRLSGLPGEQRRRGGATLVRARAEIDPGREPRYGSPGCRVPAGPRGDRRRVDGDWNGARVKHERVIAIYEARLRPGDPLTAVHHHNLGSFCWNQCDWARRCAPSREGTRITESGALGKATSTWPGR